MSDETVTEERIDPFAVLTETLELGRRGKFSFRELTVDENDNCRKAATGKDGSFDGRTMMRLMITASAVEPKISLADLARLSQPVYAQIVDFVNNLNDGDRLAQKDEDDSGND